MDHGGEKDVLEGQPLCRPVKVFFLFRPEKEEDEVRRISFL